VESALRGVVDDLEAQGIANTGAPCNAVTYQGKDGKQHVVMASGGRPMRAEAQSLRGIFPRSWSRFLCPSLVVLALGNIPEAV
jgi:hypothetical protein